MKRSILILLALWCALVTIGSMHTYGDITSRNAGVYWNLHGPGLSGHWCGYEYRGHPGFFCDVS